MFDEDDVERTAALQAIITATAPATERAIAEAEALDLPFDLHNIIDTNPYVFGDLGDGQLVGEFVRYRGGLVRNLEGEEVVSDAGIGVVVGDAFGRVVIGFETDPMKITYLGWVNPEDFEVVQIHQEVHKWLH
jgi:hypothetical protein